MACVSTEGLIGTILGGLEEDIAVIRLYAWVVCQHPVGSLIELNDRSRCKVQAVPDEGGHPSEVIRGHQRSSGVISVLITHLEVSVLSQARAVHRRGVTPDQPSPRVSVDRAEDRAELL